MGWFGRSEHDEERLSAYLDGELSSRHAENVEKHLSTCDTCAALFEELRGTRALLSALPAQTPGRSFVLGAEYARAPVRDLCVKGAPPRRFGLALAPAVALSVFVALLFVDLADFSSTSSDESSDTLLVATSRQAADEDAAGSAGAAEAPLAPESANSQADGDGTDSTVTKDEGEGLPEGSGPVAGSAGGGIETPEAPPAAMSAEALPTQAPGEAITAAGQTAEAPTPESLAFEAPETEADGGTSTLRILQVAAAAAFLASGFYVFVWPRVSKARVSRGGS